MRTTQSRVAMMSGTTGYQRCQWNTDATLKTRPARIGVDILTDEPGGIVTVRYLPAGDILSRLFVAPGY